MFSTLLESRAARQRRTHGTVASALVHGAVIAAVVAMTVPPSVDATTTTAVDPVVFTRIAPPAQARTDLSPSSDTRTAMLPTITVPPVTLNGLPPIDISSRPLPDDHITIGGPGAVTGIPTSAVPLSLFNPEGVFEVATVDRAPSILGTAPTPRYPSALRESGISGRVVVRFVVDTLGRAESDGVQILESTHGQFADAVRNALGRFRFNPGEMAGRKVRTMVQVPFTFTLRN